MLTYEMKMQGTPSQLRKLDSAIRTGRFVRNSIIRAWMDREIKSRNDAYKYCAKLAHNIEFPWAKQLNSMSRQAHAERAWAAIERFYKNCKAKVVGKKGYPKFKKYQVRASVEYKTSGWKLSEDRRYLTFTDGFQAGTFKLWGSRDLHFYQLKQIKRVRVIRKHDGYYAQFLIDHTREEDKNLTGTQVGIDLGLNHFYTNSAGEKVDNPRFLRKGERKIKKLQRRLSRTQKGSQNRSKARNRLGRAYLKVSRRRNDWACKLAQRVIQSHDLVAIENLKVRNMIKNHKLAKSIADAAWYKFREWLEYFGSIYGVPVVAVEPAYTSQNCSNCGEIVVKTLSTRTHKCPHCGYSADRDKNAAINILKSALKQLSTTLGHRESNASGENDLCLNGEIHKSKPTRKKRKLSQ
ncbi:MAG: IS200/IS605 family element transposase accessory protein TnpB [Okeania sp. SIO3B5]|uniref:RNA-guided endonuclease InsQ/TnpB family protein n=1 Tax=Okeania sp. SIO3B5 TaxID=2607811 RepID=UPI0013FEBC5D|nr:transposase [Okeania sp. SIO3B5]NEO52701.1 IS200/IS605 family element transposase accessory protein TnpB [Okeania sp. SIO3B5]